MFILCFVTGAARREDSRVFWWSQHINNLEAEKQKLLGTTDAKLISTIEREIDGAREVLSSLKTAYESPDSLLEEERKFTETEINAMVADIATLLAKTHIITRLNAGLSDDELNIQRGVVRSTVFSMIDSKFVGDIDGLTNAVVKDDITSSDWKRLDDEIFIEIILKHSSSFTRQAVTSITSTVKQKGLAGKENTKRGMKADLLKEARIYFAGIKAGQVNEAEAAELLLKASAWTEVKERLERDFKIYSMILAMTPQSKRLPVTTVRYYYKHPQAFSALLTDNTIDEKVDITGKPIGLKTANLGKEKLSDFMNAVESAKEPSGKRFGEIYESSLTRSNERASSVTVLFNECAKLYLAADPAIRDALNKDARRTTNSLFSSSPFMPVLDAKWTVYMDEELTRSLRKKVSAHEITLEKYRKEINVSCNGFSSEVNDNKKQDADTFKRARTTAARFEVYEILRALDDYKAIVQDFKYSEGAFRRYAEYFDIEIENARNAHISADIKKIIESKTLIPYVIGFDAEKIKSERIAKKFCIERIRTFATRSRAISLHYRNDQMITSDFPSAKDIEAAIKEAESKAAVSVGAWKMTDDNFQLTDEKAAMQIFLSASRSLWWGSPEVALTADENTRKLVFNKNTLTFRLPALWGDISVKTNSSIEGEIAGFASPDKTASIKVLNLSLDDEELNEFTFKWVGRGGGVPVSSRWGKTDAGDFFYCSAKKADGTIRECYALQKGEDVLIFEGETGSAKYNLFTGKLEAVFNTLVVK